MRLKVNEIESIVFALDCLIVVSEASRGKEDNLKCKYQDVTKALQKTTIGRVQRPEESPVHDQSAHDENGVAKSSLSR